MSSGFSVKRSSIWAGAADRHAIQCLSSHGNKKKMMKKKRVPSVRPELQWRPKSSLGCAGEGEKYVRACSVREAVSSAFERGLSVPSLTTLALFISLTLSPLQSSREASVLSGRVQGTPTLHLQLHFVSRDLVLSLPEAKQNTQRTFLGAQLCLLIIGKRRRQARPTC